MARTWELIVTIVSVVMMVGTLAAVPSIVRRMPADIFVRPPPRRSLRWRIARNVLGFALLAAGIAMLVLPGQGVLTMLVGLAIVDLPFRRRVLLGLLKRRAVRQGLQRLREKVGAPPLVFPPEVEP
jgi:hypothetical protein